MSRIEELIAEHCPDGVQYRELGTVINMNFGTRITKLLDSGSLYPVYGGGGESFRTDNFNREDEYVVSRFAMSEKCVRKVSGKFWMLDSGFTFSPVDELVIKDFVGHFLLNIQSEIYACSSQGAQKNLKADEFKRFLIPVPPLEVQREVVTVLDRFSQSEKELKAALEAELDARAQQFRHYRDSLITGLDPTEVPWLPMGNIGDFIRGRRFVKSDFTPSGIPCIHYGDIYTSYGTAATSAINHLSEELTPQLRFARPADVVIAAVGETVEDVGKAVAWLGETDVAIHDDCFLYRHALNSKFVSYYLQTASFHSQKEKHVSRAKVKRLSREGLGKITLPVPSKEEQERVVGVLEELEALTNKLCIDLPAELEARRKQYEYYRNQLLTFKEAPA